MKKLADYRFPEDLKKMTKDELELLAVEIREALIESVSRTGGHIASNLGVVELTIALHKVFDTPKDKIIWDVGHQSYVHKILTGRLSYFDDLRKTGGMSGFPKRVESEHDAYDTGHASTSLSAALGMAVARDLKNEKYDVVPVIGDGSLTGGLAYEGLNNIGSGKSKVIVVLNDNGMSISKNIGGVSEHLGKLRTSTGYTAIKQSIKNALRKLPKVGENVAGGISGIKEVLKYALLSGGIVFEELGFTYIGPVDGHNIEKLTGALETAKRAEGPVLVHVMTKKGKGYVNAEKNPDRFHGIGPFDPLTGKTTGSGKTFSQVFGEELLDMASQDDRICAITAAMGTATGLSDFSVSYPDRYFDVGIAEEHAVTFSAGLALSDMRPVVAIYSSFLQRAYDEILEDVALQDLPVVFAIDRAGIVGADGETHQGIFDIAYLSTVPGMTVLAPATGTDLRKMLRYALTLDSPCAIRYSRGSCHEDEKDETPYDGNNSVISEGKDVQILAVGTMLNTALEVRSELSSSGIDCGVTYVSRPHPVDETLVPEGVPCVTMEDGIITGGFGEQLKAKAPSGSLIDIIAFPDSFIEHGSTDDLFRKYGMDSKGIAERIRKQIER